jgi:UDP-GlcNAc:undecaprenyl-phosphate GlcNAc-1-phosphate transferase
MILTTVELISIFLSFGISLTVTFLIIRLSKQTRYSNLTNDKLLPVSIVELGGLGIFFSSFLLINEKDIGGYLFICALPSFIAGFVKDYTGKFGIEQRLAIITLSSLLAITIIPNTAISIFEHRGTLLNYGVLAILIYIPVVTNGINFTDGQNGISIGTTLISILAVLTIAIDLNEYSIVYICSIISAGLFAFLLFNLPTGKIWAGNSGNYYIGFITAILVVLLVKRNSALSPSFIIAVLIYPIWEFWFTIIRKLFFDKSSLFRPDKYHLQQLFIHDSNKKNYLPSLFILPFQVLIGILVVIHARNDLILNIIMISYITVYCTAYYYQRKIHLLMEELNNNV